MIAHLEARAKTVMVQEFKARVMTEYVRRLKEGEVGLRQWQSPRTAMNNFVKLFGEEQLSNLKGAQIKAAIAEIKEDKTGRALKDNIFGYIKTSLNLAAKEFGYLEKNPPEGMDGFSVDKKKKPIGPVPPWPSNLLTMGTTSHSIEVDAPVRVVYNQWTQFEDFPHFMEGVEEVRQEGDKKLFWRAKIGGKIKEWEARITDQVPDQRIAWESIDGSPNSGMVTFVAAGPSATQVTATIDYEPEGFLEKAGDALGIPSAKVEGDLQRFRNYIEERGRATGGWRGEIAEGESPYLGALPTAQTGAIFQAAPVTDQALETETVSERAIGHPAETSSEGTIEVPLSEEEVKVGKRTVDAGKVTLRKTVSTETVSVPVELKREDLVIERIQPHEVTGANSEAFAEKNIVVPLSREEAVVEKVTNVTGGVRVRKTEGTEKEIIQETVRREEVKIDESGKIGVEHRVVKDESSL